jgi:hypothetical protein
MFLEGQNISAGDPYTLLAYVSRVVGPSMNDYSEKCIGMVGETNQWHDLTTSPWEENHNGDTSFGIFTLIEYLVVFGVRNSIYFVIVRDGGLGFVDVDLGLDQLQRYSLEHPHTFTHKKRGKILKHRGKKIDLVVGKDIKLDGIMELDERILVEKFVGRKVAYTILGDWILELWSLLLGCSLIFHILCKGWI